MKFVIKNSEALHTYPFIYTYINKINIRLVFKIKVLYKLELQTPENIRLFGSTKKIDKTKNVENVPVLEVAEVVLVQRSLVDNQYQQSEVLYSFKPSKCYSYLLNVKPSNLVFL